MYPQLQAGLVRIYTAEKGLSGIGFLISPRLVICTASSIRASLGKEVTEHQALEMEVALQFFGGPSVRGRVIIWQPVISDEIVDVAVVELDTKVVLDINPLRLAISESPIGRVFQTIGFVPGIESPVLVQGEAREGDKKGKIEFRDLQSEGIFQLPGFLGAPIWDDDLQAVVAMLTLLETDSGTIPNFLRLEVVSDFIPDLILRYPAEKPGLLYNVPDLPANLILRKDYFQYLRSALLTGRQIRTGKGTVSGTTGYVGMTTTGLLATLRSERIVLQGTPGIGKTTLAATVVRDNYLRRVYPDGIFWLTIGPSPDLTLCQSKLALMAGASYGGFSEPRQGRRALRGLLSNRACLLILDDVWDASHAASFDCLGPGGMLLIIGREIGLAGALRARRIQLGPMNPKEAKELICLWAGISTASAPPEVGEVIQECSYNPLALTLAGSVFRSDISNWIEILAQLRSYDTSPYHSRLGAYRGLIASIMLSYNSLPSQIKERYRELAVFLPGVPIPYMVTNTFWKDRRLSKEIIQEILTILVNRNLIQLDARGQGKPYFIIHDFLYAFISILITDFPFLHQRFIRSYGILPPKDDGWILGHLISHLRQAGLLDEIRNLLFRYKYLYERLNSYGIDELINDYVIAMASSPLSLWDRGQSGEALLAIQNALRLAITVLAKYPDALPGQLIARLAGFSNPFTQQLIAEAMEEKRFPWLRPLTKSLVYPGSRCLNIIRGHAGKVNSLVISSDGSKIISAGVDKEICIWDIHNGQLIGVMRGHAGAICDLALTPDGNRVISASVDGTIRIWLLNDGSCLKTLRGNQPQVIALAPTPDGRRLVSSGSDRTLCVWDLERSTLIRTYRLHDGWVKAVAVLPGSLQAVSGGTEIKLWDIETGQVMYSLNVQGEVSEFSLSSDGSSLISNSLEGELSIWDVPTGRMLHSARVPRGRVAGMSMIYGTHKVIVASSDKNIYTLGLDSGRFIDSIELSSSIVSIAITPDGQKVVSSDNQGVITIWDRNDYRRLRTLRGHPSQVTKIKILPDENRVVSGSADGSIKGWDLASGIELFQIFNQGKKNLSLACANNGRILAGGFEDGSIKVWDLFNQHSPQILQGHDGPVLALDITPDGRRAISGSADAVIKVWDIEPNEDNPLGLWSLQMELIGHTSWVRGVKALPDNWRVMSVSADRTMKLWDIENAKLIYSIEAHAREVNDLALLAHGSLAVTAGDDHLLRVWNTNTGQLLYKLTGHVDEVNTVDASLDANRILSGSTDRSIRVWDIPNKWNVTRRSQQELKGKMVKASLTLEEHVDWVNSVAITKDGRRALSGSEDRSIIEWDISENGEVSFGKAPDHLPLHKGSVLALAMSSDCRFLLSSGEDQVIYLWWIQRGNRNRLFQVNCKQNGQLTGGTTNLLCYFNDGLHFCGCGEDNVIRIWDIEQFDMPIRELDGHTKKVSNICVSKRGDRIWSADVSSLLRVYETNSGKLIYLIHDLDSPILYLNSVSRSDQTIAVCMNGRICRWNGLTAKNSLDAHLLVKGDSVNLKKATVDSLGKLAAGYSDNGDIHIWDLSSPVRKSSGNFVIMDSIITFTPSKSAMNYLSFANFDKCLALISNNNLDIWNYGDKKLVTSYQSDGNLSSLSASPNSTVMFAGDYMGNVHFLNLEIH